MNLESIEIERQKKLKSFKILFFPSLIIAVVSLVVALLMDSENQVRYVFFVLCAVFAMLMLVAVLVPSSQYSKFCKKDLEMIVLKDVFKDAKQFEYYESNKLDYKDLARSKLLRSPYKFKTFDTLYTDYKDVEIILTNFDFITLETHTDSEGHTHTTEEHHYGRYIEFNLEKTFDYELAIVEKGNNPQIICSKPFKEKVEFESVDFNKKFTCTCNDKQTAYVLIQPKEMVEFLDMHKDYKGQISYSFIKKKVFFILNGTKTSISYNLFSKLSDKKINEVRSFYNLPIDVIDRLKLHKDKFNDID